MVSPPVLLGTALGLVLALIGAYVAWLGARLDRLEARIEDERAGDADDEEPHGG